MKGSLIAVLGLIGTLVGAGCSSGSDATPQANLATNANSNSTASVKSGDYAGAPQPADSNGMTANAGDNTNAPAANMMQSKLDKMRKSGQAAGDFGDVEAMALKAGRPAPDDSTYASYLTDVGYEVRSFRNHPQILKVVKRIDGDSQSLKVYLRNGKVVDIPVQRVPSLATVSVSVILEAAGIKPLPPPAPAGPPIPGKKGDD